MPGYRQSAHGQVLFGGYMTHRCIDCGSYDHASTQHLPPVFDRDELEPRRENIPAARSSHESDAHARFSFADFGRTVHPAPGEEVQPRRSRAFDASDFAPGGALAPKTGLAGDSAARKAAPVYEGFMCYFPNAIAEVSRLSMAGNEKHNKGQPLHWSFNVSNDHGNCIGRHQLQAEEVDPDSGENEFLHAVMVAWRAMAQLETLLLKTRPELTPGKNVKGFKR